MEEESWADSLPEAVFREYLAYIHEITGITVGSNRRTMLQGRFRKRIRELGLSGYAEYLEFVKSRGDERRVFIDLITTNETYFFRTPRIWDHIYQTCLPEWHALHRGETFKAWSAASSSGAEACSLGVLCQEYQDRNSSFRYQILGTDISAEMIELCRQGKYSGRSVDTFQKARPSSFQKYLVADESGYKLVPQIRQHIQFKQHNLFERLKGAVDFHLILLRNVLIYFARADQQKVLEHIHASLAPNGILIIGESESLVNFNTPFEHIAPLIYKKPASGCVEAQEKSA